MLNRNKNRTTDDNSDFLNDEVRFRNRNGTTGYKSFSIEEKSDIKIVNLGDVHLGNSACDRDFFEKTITYIKENPNCYWLSTGDLMEVNTHKGKHYDYKGMAPTEEVNLLVGYLEQIKDKCLGIVSSNHSERIVRLSGYDIDWIFQNKLKIEHYGALALFDVSLCSDSNKKNIYTIAMHHGKSCGGTMGAKANSILKLYDILPCADIYLEGHSHTYLSFQREINFIDRNHKRVRNYSAHFCITGHCIKWVDSYAASEKYVPMPIGFAELTLSHNFRNIETRLLTPTNIGI